MPHHEGRTRVRDRIAARTGFSAVARALSDYAAACVPTETDEHAEPGEWITFARRIGVLHQEAKFRAVVMARESGASWEEVARALGYRDRYGRPDVDAVREVFGEPYELWRQGEDQPWTPEGCTPAVPDADLPPADVAADLDAWVLHRRAGAPGDPHPVSGALGLAGLAGR